VYVWQQRRYGRHHPWRQRPGVSGERWQEQVFYLSVHISRCEFAERLAGLQQRCNPWGRLSIFGVSRFTCLLISDSRLGGERRGFFGLSAFSFSLFVSRSSLGCCSSPLSSRFLINRTKNCTRNATLKDSRTVLVSSTGIPLAKCLPSSGASVLLIRKPARV
jgi:hypothetical protein